MMRTTYSFNKHTFQIVFGINNLYLGVLLFIAIFITCYETFSQEAKSDSLMEKFRAMVPEQASVIRDGVMKPLSATEIVIGNILK